MPLSIEKFESLRRTKLTLLGEEVGITYRLNAIDADLADWLLEHREDAGAIRDMIERIVADWEILGPDGTHIPATRVCIEEYRIPTPVLGAIFEAVIADTQPGKLSRMSSRGT